MRNVLSVKAVVAATVLAVMALSCTGCLSRRSETAGETCDLHLLVDTPQPIEARDKISVSLRLRNDGKLPTGLWTIRQDKENARVPTTFTLTTNGYKRRGSVLTHTKQTWEWRTITPGNSLTWQEDYNTVTLAEDDYELRFRHDISQGKSLPAEVAACPGPILESESIKVSVRNGFRVPTYSGECPDVPNRHPQLTSLPAILRKPVTLEAVLDVSDKEQFPDLADFFKREAGVEVLWEVSSVVYPPEPREGSSVFLIFSMRVQFFAMKVPLFRVFDIIAAQCGPDVVWSYDDGKVRLHRLTK